MVPVNDELVLGPAMGSAGPSAVGSPTPKATGIPSDARRGRTRCCTESPCQVCTSFTDLTDTVCVTAGRRVGSMSSRDSFDPIALPHVELQLDNRHGHAVSLPRRRLPTPEALTGFRYEIGKSQNARTQVA